MSMDWTTLNARETGFDAAVARLEAETVRRVNREMRGQDAARVHSVLMSRLRGRLPGVPHNPMHVQRLAQAISRGTLPDSE
ncbi:MAG: hypothetical protein QM747_15050 [Nocardioides sp.]